MKVKQRVMDKETLKKKDACANVCVCVCVCTVTCNGCPAHEVRVGKVQSGVEHKVGLHDTPGALADVVEEPRAPHRHSALVAVLQKRKKIKETGSKSPLLIPQVTTSTIGHLKHLELRVPAGFSALWRLQTSHWGCEETSCLCNRLLPW